MTFPTKRACLARPSRSRFAKPLGSLTSSRSATASVTRRLISSGMLRSKLRSPASRHGPGHHRIGVPLHQDHIGPLCHQHFFQICQDPPRLLSMIAGAYI